jgi:hypothetical protein
MSDDEIERVFARLKWLASAARLPEVEVGTSYGRPSLKTAGKAFATVKDPATIVIAIAIDDKERLIEMAPDIYFQTDHYVGWPSLPVRVAVIGDDELMHRLVDAWRFRTPRRQRAMFDAGQNGLR